MPSHPPHALSSLATSLPPSDDDPPRRRHPGSLRDTDPDMNHPPQTRTHSSYRPTHHHFRGDTPSTVRSPILTLALENLTTSSHPTRPGPPCGEPTHDAVTTLRLHVRQVVKDQHLKDQDLAFAKPVTRQTESGPGPNHYPPSSPQVFVRLVLASSTSDILTVRFTPVNPAPFFFAPQPLWVSHSFVVATCGLFGENSGALYS